MLSAVEVKTSRCDFDSFLRYAECSTWYCDSASSFAALIAKVCMELAMHKLSKILAYKTQVQQMTCLCDQAGSIQEHFDKALK